MNMANQFTCLQSADPSLVATNIVQLEPIKSEHLFNCISREHKHTFACASGKNEK